MVTLGKLSTQQCSPSHVYRPIMHLDLKNEKIWIQQNTTEVDIALELIEMGVLKHDIVIGFNSPKMR
ncbi:element excision factor XisI family protein [Scytonema sp. NUACC26]|uniref:element excision factor XisI family protein n=1 Tax=Scytonema sp. NUACC26 TaxID=3140176 RepID=UPI0038B3A2E5